MVEDTMKLRLTSIASITVVILLSNPSIANERHTPQVIPAHEHAIANKNNLSGPSKTHGIKSVTVLGSIGLEKDFPALNGRQLRARELVIAPGGVVAVHQHDSRPGVAYILEGEIIEHRSDQSEAIVRKQGAVAFEQSGVAHWWENKSEKPVRALVVDIVKTP